MLILKQDSWFHSHLGHCSLGGNPKMPLLASPPGICLPSTLNKLYPLFFYRHPTKTEYAFFSQGVDRLRKEMASMWGNINICLPLQWFRIPSLTPVELSSLTSLKAWGEAEGLPWHRLPVGTSWGGSYRGQEIWSINHLGKPWLGQCPLYGGSGWESDHLGLQWTQLALYLGVVTWGHPNAPLPKEGHLGILPQRGAETTACGRISQLEVCQLLVSGPQVTYPIGLNGCEEPIITSLPGVPGQWHRPY